MTSLGVSNSLSAVLVPIGWVGAALAVICAVIAGIAVARGAGGLSGGAVGLWIPTTMLSVTASFANEWMPLVAATGALVAMLVLGGTVRAIVSTAQAPEPAYPRSNASTTPAPAARKPAAPSPRTSAVGQVTTSTGGLALTRPVRST
ncbi:hypothetical protein [Microbacterium sp.]|uniref:hypothetical protein n=1 Tax=Microbacterium sp. TaxID=51671 RepID=UPI002810B6D1|nr:hypothetical protein [Microbacterium sp.]